MLQALSETMYRSLDESMDEHGFVPTQYKESALSRNYPPNQSMEQLNSNSRLSLYQSPETVGSQRWQATHGNATFSQQYQPNDISVGISRSIAHDMQSEAETQLRHQIRDTV